MSFWDDLTGKTAANASNAAAASTYANQQAATQGITNAGNQYNAGVQGLAGNYSPYTGAGNSALQQLLGGLGIGGNGGDQFTNVYQNSPGYKAGQAAGINAIDKSANARGMLQSGRTQKALYSFGQKYDQDAANNYINQLMGVTNLGYGATGAQTGVQQAGLQGQLGANTSAFQGNMQAAPTIGLGQVAGANAQQQGASNLLGTAAYLGGAALGGGMGGTGGSALASLFKPTPIASGTRIG